MLARLFLGLLFGAAFALVGIWLAPEADPVAAVSTTTTTLATDTTRPAPVWMSPRETVLGPTVLVPESFEVEGEEVVFNFSLYDISPDALGRIRSPGETNLFFPEPPPSPVLVPELWTMTTVDGEVTGSSASNAASTARFPIDDTFIKSKVTGMRIDTWRMRMPYVYTVDIPVDSAEPIPIDGGVVISIARVLRQRTSVIVQLDIELPDDHFAVAGLWPYPRIRGVGANWRAGGPRDGGLQMLWQGPDIPDVITLEIRSVRWIPFDDPIEVDMTGMLDA